MTASYAPEALATFLRAMDTHLQVPEEIIIIGGTAMALGFAVNLGTHDIDTVTQLTDNILLAVARAAQDTGFNIPFNHTAVFDPPQGYEARCTRILAELSHLAVRIPEKHDLALMKLARGDQHDIDAVAALHQARGLSFDVLLERYMHGMKDTLGSAWKRDMAFLTAMETIFGGSAADRAQEQLQALRAC